MKLQYYIDEKGNKTYTLKKTSPLEEPTKSAHYKFIRIPSVKEKHKS